MPGYRRGAGGGPAAGGGGRTSAPGPGIRAPRPAPPPARRPPPSRGGIEDDEEADYQLPGEDEEEAPARARPRGSAEPVRARTGGRGRSRREIEETAAAPVRLVDLCAEFFSLILQLRATGEMPEPVALEHKISALFDEMKERATEARIPPADVEHARYAIAAFIDETVLNSPSPMKDAWIAMPLQMRYWSENTAGEGFFDRLDQIRKVRGARDALEVYYLCLTLGFEGRYRLSPGGELATLIDQIRQELQPRARRGGGSQVSLAPNGPRPDSAQGPQKRQLPLYLIAGGFALLVVIVLIVVSHSVGSSARTEATRLRELAGAAETR
ncbi:MAG TPA: type IVB secretion system protein IcmH/DotU [Polyangia bacterium]|nr:type IVB secretion system protein IcmH/DotU [Polyangia bacterium]